MAVKSPGVSFRSSSDLNPLQPEDFIDERHRQLLSNAGLAGTAWLELRDPSRASRWSTENSRRQAITQRLYGVIDGPRRLGALGCHVPVLIGEVNTNQFSHLAGRSRCRSWYGARACDVNAAASDFAGI